MTSSHPRLLLFDVNGTLSDMAPLARRFAEVGAPPHLMAVWFTGVLRDGFALTTAGGYASFREIAESGLHDVLAGQRGWSGGREAAVEHVLAGFSELEVHPDVPDGVRRLQGAGHRLATLTNGSVNLTEQLLERAGIRSAFEALLDVSDAHAWKPAAAAYRYALDRLHCDPAETMLVAVHPWDITGAARAGLQTAWLRRGSPSYPAVMAQPTITAADLRDLAHLLG